MSCFQPRLFNKSNTWTRYGVTRLFPGWSARLCLILCKFLVGALHPPAHPPLPPAMGLHRDALKVITRSMIFRQTVTVYCNNETIYLNSSMLTLNPLNAELNPICHLLALLGAHYIFHVSGLRVNIPRGVLWGPQRVIFCDPAVTITTNLLLIFVCVPHQLKINIMQLDF